MVLPKVLSPSFWVDKCLTLVLQLVLALLLQILYILKGEDVRVTDVKVTTVRKTIPSDGKSIIQAPAKATRPTRQNIKAGPNATPDDSTREIKAPIIVSEKPEEQIITGTLTELKPDKIGNIEAKAEISTSTATPIMNSEESKPVVIEHIETTPEVKVDNAETISETVEQSSETHSEEDSEIIAEPVETKAPETEIRNIIISEPEVIPEVNTNKAEEGSELISEPAEAEVDVDEIQVSETISDESENNTEIAKLPREMKTSYEVSHLTDSNIKLVEFRWNHDGTQVFVTGDFDNWQVTHEMQWDYTTGGFTAFIPIDCTKQHEFKFVVDGNWWINTDLPTKRDEHGNENNIIYAFGSDSLSPEYKEYAEVSTSYQLTAAY